MRDKKRIQALGNSLRNLSVAILLTAVICLILYSFKIPNPKVVLQAKIKQLDYVLTSPLTIGVDTSIYLQEIQLFSLDSCSVIPKKKDYSLSIKNGFIRLDKLLFKSGSRLTVSVDQGELLLFVENNNVSGKINAKNAFINSSDLGINKKIGKSDSGDFIHFLTTMNPQIYLRAKSNSGFSIPKSQIESISFITSPDTTTTSRSPSTIESGILNICGIESLLQKEEVLKIGPLENGSLEILKIDKKFIHINASFKSKTVNVFSNKEPSSLKPSLFECYYNNNRIVFWIFTIAPSVLSFLQPMVKLFFSSHDEE